MNAAFTRLANTPTFIPMQGDICVWTMGNKNGHIAIAEGTGNNLAYKRAFSMVCSTACIRM